MNFTNKLQYNGKENFIFDSSWFADGFFQL